jgi:pimeloyl-ACP methyl ester carboxylesterase
MKPSSFRPGWSGWLRALTAAAALAVAVVAQRAHAEPGAPGLRNIVLVHGAFADGSSWSEVIAILQRKGYHVTAVQNSLTSLADDVAATRRVLDRQQGDVLLVGHSWAGAVVTEAGNAPNVKGLVYLSALAPDSNESVGDLLARLHAPMEGLKPDGNGLIWLDDPAAYRQVMAGDVRAAKARLLAAVQQPIAAGAFGEKVSHAAWRDKPSWYLVTDNDHALPPAVQRELAKETGAHRVALQSSHMSMVSHPADVADLIDRAARDSINHQ